VPGVEVDLEHLLPLDREEDPRLLLGAAQDQRIDVPPELGQPLLVALVDDRVRVVVVELVGIGKQPGPTAITTGVSVPWSC